MVQLRHHFELVAEAIALVGEATALAGGAIAAPQDISENLRNTDVYSALLKVRS